MSDAWDGIEIEWEEDHQPSPESLATATRLIIATRSAGMPPVAADVGYWPTVRLFWDDAPVEVEAFPESFELNWLPKPETGETYSIREFSANKPGELERFISELGSFLSRGKR